VALSQQLQQQQQHQSSIELANRLWQNLLGLSGTPSSVVGTPTLDLSNLPGTIFSTISSGQQPASSQPQKLVPKHALFQPIGSGPESQNGMCAWPECNQSCENFAAFIPDLRTVQVVDEKSTQQCRTQIELVDSLEHRLSKERARLQAMMQHLHMKVSRLVGWGM